MSEYNPFIFTQEEELRQIETELQLANEANTQYRSIQTVTDYPLDELVLIESRMSARRRSSYLMDTASCAVDIALYPETCHSEGYEDREKYLEAATGYWKTVYHREIDKPNDLAELAKWNLSQLPTFRAIAEFIEDPTQPKKVHEEQETEFINYFKFVLSRWDHEVLDGHVLESLTSYFAHRSNKLRADSEPPIYATASPIRDDHHTQAERRVDVDVYYLPWRTKFGVQVKGGRIEDPYADKPVRHRIFFNNARRALCIPTTDASLKRTIQAIVSDPQKHQDALDTIAADHRARLYREIYEENLIGTRFLGSTALR